MHLILSGFAGSRSGSHEAAAPLDRPMRMVFTRWGRKALILVVSLAAVVARGPMWSQGPGGWVAPHAAPPVPASPVAADLELPGGTLVQMELVDEVSTRKSKAGDFFKLRVAEAVRIQDRIAIPAGAKAVGQVVDSQAGGIFGNPARLVIAVRFVDLGNRLIPMFCSQASLGADRTREAMHLGLVPFAGPFAALIQGGEIILPAGTKLIAKAVPTN